MVRGFAQVKSINYEETYSPFVNYSSMRYLLSVAAERNLEIHHMDVTTAYLNSELNDDIYVLPPSELSNKSGKIWKLKKAMV